MTPGVRGSCSAVVIAPEKALTAAHCITIPEMALQYDDGQLFPVLGALPDVLGRDLATLSVPGLVGPTAVTTSYPVQTDELIYAVGYPYGIGNVLTVGQFQFRVNNADDGFQYLLSTVMVGPGNSGGALFVVRDGVPYLIGIIVAFAGSPYLAIAIELP
jgi:V8-like Glu-specific endopeptidase